MSGMTGAGMAGVARAGMSGMITGENTGIHGQLHSARLGLRGWRYLITLADRVLCKLQVHNRLLAISAARERKII